MVRRLSSATASSYASVFGLVGVLSASAAHVLPGAAQPTGPQPAQVTAIEHVAVIPMDRERVLADHTVVVRGDRIEAVGPSASVTVPGGARRVDARGAYLLPTLAEMHAHIPGGQATDAQVEQVLFLYAAHGIGTIRGMLGHPRHLALRDRANRGELVSPTIYTSGPSLNGNSIPTAEAARAEVKAQKQAGYDLLKIHPGVPRAAFDALAETAHGLSLPFAGHVPADVGLDRALEARFHTIDHLDGYAEALAGEGAPAAQLFGLNLASRLDESRLPAVVARTKAAGVAQVVTQALLEHWVGTDTPETMAGWPEMRFVPRAQIEQWTRQKQQMLGGASTADRARLLEIRRRLIKRMHQDGVTLLLGSDAPQTWNVPGASAHRELAYLVGAGLRPWDALETGTRAVARFLGTPDRGRIEAGTRADLLVVAANPLDDIRNVSKIEGVMLGGRWMPRPELDERLQAIAREAGTH